MYKKQQNAYMTLEASLILPVIFAGIIFAIYVGIYFYDISTMKQVAYIGALRHNWTFLQIFVNRQGITAASSKQIHRQNL